MRILILGGTAEASALAKLYRGATIAFSPHYRSRGGPPSGHAARIPYRISGFGGWEGLAAWIKAERRPRHGGRHAPIRRAHIRQRLEGELTRLGCCVRQSDPAGLDRARWRPMDARSEPPSLQPLRFAPLREPCLPGDRTA